MVLRVSLCYINKFYNSTQLDWLWAPFFSKLFRFKVILSRWTFHKKCFFSGDTKKNVIYSKIVNNPFKGPAKEHEIQKIPITNDCLVMSDSWMFIRIEHQYLIWMKVGVSSNFIIYNTVYILVDGGFNAFFTLQLLTNS